MKNLFLIIYVLFIYGCHKDKPSNPALVQHFKGKVFDFTSGTAVANANLQLIRANGPWFITDVSELVYPIYNYTVSDDSGYFQFDLPLDAHKLVYKIVASKSGCVNVDTSYTRVKYTSSSIDNYYDSILLDSASILQINFLDTSSSSFNDTLRVLVAFGDSGSYINPSIHFSDRIFLVNHNSLIHVTESVSYKQNNSARIMYGFYRNFYTSPFDTTVSLTKFSSRILNLSY